MMEFAELLDERVTTQSSCPLAVTPPGGKMEAWLPVT